MANDWDTVSKIIDDVTRYLKEKKTLTVIGDYNEDTIRKRTRLGKGVDTTAGAQTKLEIKDSTFKIRKELKKKGKLSSKTTPAKANLTRSGEMLDSLHSEVNTADTSVTTKVSKPNQRKANKLAKGGHKFLNLTKGEFKGLVEVLVRGLLKRIK